MESITINVRDGQMAERILWFLKHFEGEGLEIVSREDLDDLRLIKETRGEETISFEDYLKNENQTA